MKSDFIQVPNPTPDSRIFLYIPAKKYITASLLNTVARIPMTTTTIIPIIAITSLGYDFSLL
ncbi:hypothetical protein [Pediococcus argentinicus]|uniref:hypothetical protein n=1 Tax=Pediococcus argentinicus TaxID=480391 RepID=UPI0011BE68A3|nr:hypothetical protein [Pediococcus argentinicus]NKZ22580.1 hypothetical protein [Pediococcus argentinicus]